MTNEHIKQTAEKLAFQWQRTPPMHSREEVRRAVSSVEDELTYTERGTEERVHLDPEEAVDALLPLLRRDGLLIDD